MSVIGRGALELSIAADFGKRYNKANRCKAVRVNYRLLTKKYDISDIQYFVVSSTVLLYIISLIAYYAIII